MRMLLVATHFCLFENLLLCLVWWEKWPPCSEAETKDSENIFFIRIHCCCRKYSRIFVFQSDSLLFFSVVFFLLCFWGGALFPLKFRWRRLFCFFWGPFECCQPKILKMETARMMANGGGNMILRNLCDVASLRSVKIRKSPERYKKAHKITEKYK